jgi:hypothetical protein
VASIKPLLAVLACCAVSNSLMAQTKTPPAPRTRTAPLPSPSDLTKSFAKLLALMDGQTSTHQVSIPGLSPSAEVLTISGVKSDSATCSLSWKEANDTDIRLFDLKLRSVNNVTVSLRDATPMVISPPIWDVLLDINRPFTSRVHYAFGYGHPPYDKDEDVVLIEVGSQTDATRLQTALTEVVAACQQVAPGARPQMEAPNIGPTLEDSAKFINEQLMNEGAFHFIAHRSGDKQGDVDIVVNRQSFSVAANCISDFEILGGLTLGESLKTPLEETDPRDILVEDLGIYEHQKLLKQEPNPLNIGILTDPPVYIVSAKGFGGYFLDKSIAERVAKAYIHASVLCGAGKNQLF